MTADTMFTTEIRNAPVLTKLCITNETYYICICLRKSLDVSVIVKSFQSLGRFGFVKWDKASEYWIKLNDVRYRMHISHRYLNIYVSLDCLFLQLSQLFSMSFCL